MPPSPTITGPFARRSSNRVLTASTLLTQIVTPDGRSASTGHFRRTHGRSPRVLRAASQATPQKQVKWASQPTTRDRSTDPRASILSVQRQSALCGGASSVDNGSGPVRRGPPQRIRRPLGGIPRGPAGGPPPGTHPANG